MQRPPRDLGTHSSALLHCGCLYAYFGAGLPVQSAGVAAVSQSFAPPPASTPPPTPAPEEKSAADAALQAWNEKMIKVCCCLVTHGASIMVCHTLALFSGVLPLSREVCVGNVSALKALVTQVCRWTMSSSASSVFKSAQC